MKHTLVWALLLVMTGATRADVVMVSGADVLNPAMLRELAEQSPVTLEVLSEDKISSLQMLIEGKAAVIFTARPLDEKEMDKARRGGATLQPFAFAREGLAVIVSDKVPLKEISREKMSEIFTGRDVRWPELGVDGEKIFACGPNDAQALFNSPLRDDGTYSEHWKFHGRFGFPGMGIVPSEHILSYVRNDTKHLGQIRVSFLHGNMHGFKMVPVDGLLPTPAAIQGQSYPYLQELYLYTRGAPEGKAREAVDYLTGAEAGKILSKYGMVPAADSHGVKPLGAGRAVGDEARESVLLGTAPPADRQRELTYCLMDLVDFKKFRVAVWTGAYYGEKPKPPANLSEPVFVSLRLSWQVVEILNADGQRADIKRVGELFDYAGGARGGVYHVDEGNEWALPLPFKYPNKLTLAGDGNYLYLPGTPYWNNCTNAVFIYRVNDDLTVSEPFVYYVPENPKEKARDAIEFEREVLKKHFPALLGELVAREVTDVYDDVTIDKVLQLVTVSGEKFATMQPDVNHTRRALFWSAWNTAIRFYEQCPNAEGQRRILAAWDDGLRSGRLVNYQIMSLGWHCWNRDFLTDEFWRLFSTTDDLKILGAGIRVLIAKGDDDDLQRVWKMRKNFSVEKNTVLQRALNNRQYLRTNNLWDMPPDTLPDFD